MGILRRRLFVSFAIAVILFIAIRAAYVADRGPVYEGRTLDDLLSCYTRGANPSAIHSWSEAEEEQWKQRRQEAGEILRLHSREAVPELRKRLNEEPWTRLQGKFFELRSFFSKLAGGEPLPQVLFRLREVEAVSAIGDDAASLAPDLMKVIRKYRSRHVGDRALWALGRLHGDPKIIVPFLIESLDMPSQASVANALEALGEYGPESMAVVPKMIEIMKKDVGFIRLAGASALLKIDPEAAISVLPLLQESMADESVNDYIRKRLQRVIEDIESHGANEKNHSADR